MKRLKASHPEIRIMVLTMHAEPAIIKSIIKEQPNAFLLKNTDTGELTNAIAAVLEGKTFYAREVQQVLIEDIQGKGEPGSNIIPALSARELEVLQLIAEECTTQEIADRIFLSTNTIETYRQNLLRKLEAKNSAGLVAKAYQLGIL